MHTRELCSIEMYDNTVYICIMVRELMYKAITYMSRSRNEATLRPEIDLQVIYGL